MNIADFDKDLVRIIAFELAAGGSVRLPRIGTLSNRLQPARAAGSETGVKVTAPKPKLTFEPERASKEAND